MLRTVNILHSYRRISTIFSRNRIFSTHSERCYIIKSRDGRSVIMTDGEILKRFKENQRRLQSLSDPTKALATVLLQFYHQQKHEAISMIKKHKIDEKLISFSKIQSEKLRVNFSELQEKMKSSPPTSLDVKQKIAAFRQSQIFVKIMNFPKLVISYWEIFLMSGTRQKLEKVARWIWSYGKIVSTFIREAYFEKKGVYSKTEDIFLKYRK